MIQFIIVVPVVVSGWPWSFLTGVVYSTKAKMLYKPPFGVRSLRTFSWFSSWWKIRNRLIQSWTFVRHLSTARTNRKLSPTWRSSLSPTTWFSKTSRHYHRASVTHWGNGLPWLLQLRSKYTRDNLLWAVSCQVPFQNTDRSIHSWETTAVPIEFRNDHFIATLRLDSLFCLPNIFFSIKKFIVIYQLNYFSHPSLKEHLKSFFDVKITSHRVPVCMYSCQI